VRLWLATLFAAGVIGSPVTYLGGTSALLTRGEALRIDTTGHQLKIFSEKRAISVPYDDINLIEYGQKVNPRILEAVIISPLLLLSKKKDHYLTLGYRDTDGHQQALVFEVPKASLRPLLFSLESKTGLKVDHQDSTARRDPKGSR